MDDEPLRVGVVGEQAAGERRVALTPDSIPELTAAGMRIQLAAGAGVGSSFPDPDYTAAGADVVAPDAGTERAAILVSVNRPPETLLRSLAPGTTVIGLLQPHTNPQLIHDLAAAGLTLISLDGLPRTLSRAQVMDALTSQASVAGYKAALVAATAYDRYFPLLMSAAGVAKPAQVLVLGAGVAGLQAIATARRLGAVVTGYDVRPETHEEIASLGAHVLQLADVAQGSGSGGYARALDLTEQDTQRAALAERIGRFDVVITTAQVPGKPPPVLVTSAALDQLRPGSVVVDMAAGEWGGNVVGSQPEQQHLTTGGVTLIGAGNLAATVPRAASAAYSRNVTALLSHLVTDGRLRIDLDEEIQAGVVVTHGGAVVHPGAVDTTPALLSSGGGEDS